MNAGFKIKKRDDLIPSAIDLMFRITGTWGALQYTQVIHDIAGDTGAGFVEGIGLTGALTTVQTFATGSPVYVGGAANSAPMQALQAAGRDFGAVAQTIDMEGANMSYDTCTFNTIGVDLRDPSLYSGSSLPFWKAIFPELADITNLAFYTGSAVKIVDDSGADLTPNIGAGIGYNYLLTRGQVASWMLSGGGAACQSINAKITVQFTGTENASAIVSGAPTAVPLATVPQHIKHATVTLVTLLGGTYTNENITAGEVIPYGLAGYIYNIAKIPQYEGTFTIQETEITDACPIGNNLNLSGGLGEWATMQAMVQQVSYDLTSGRTTITFGPAAHLGAKDFVERLRVNRGPRWYNLNGANLANAAGTNNTQLGRDVAKADPAHGPKSVSQQLFPQNIADIAANPAGLGVGYNQGFPGVAIDSRASGQHNWGAQAGSEIGASGIPFPTDATIFMAAGSGGTLGACIRLSVSDCGGYQLWVQPMSVCYMSSPTATPVIKTVYFLCSKPH